MKQTNVRKLLREILEPLGANVVGSTEVVHRHGQPAETVTTSGRTDSDRSRVDELADWLEALQAKTENKGKA